jgi:type IV secretory pathway VirB10-like protein
MSRDDRKRALGKDLLIASAMVAAGVVISWLSLTQLGANNPQIAQTTQPLQSTPGAETKPSAPSEPTTTGVRPTEIPPQPARPDAEAQKAGATPALPPAPAEKMAPPIKER